ncbi:hypothetical protein J416_05598 [Gracilibacillus halophilus YIM-C55.5]|uniref:Uncharacterized protein n=1 Tax=Gracilibacillus halophilus YIM-C55.5 TaxID=1308866 RepID=N4WSX6_9BACI|nr:hypothetical protein [Gracilibacillus halophilus]ENH97460.1 hypothetical protein J416_05598 [Gracilibacillus halophilus YIM-C55.5]
MEVLIASLLFFTICIFIFQLLVQVQLDEKSLYQKRIIASYVHDIVRETTINDATDIDRSVNHLIEQPVHIHTETTKGVKEVCATWVSERNQQQKYCLYG